MAEEVANPKIQITVEQQAAIKAFLETGNASKDLGKAIDALGDKIEASYKGKVDKVERGYQSFERTISRLASEIKGNGATTQLNQLALAVDKAGGASKLSSIQVDNLRSRIESLKAAGGTVPPELAKITAGAGGLTQALSRLTQGDVSGAFRAIGPEALVASAGVAALGGAAVLAGGQIVNAFTAAVGAVVNATKAVVDHAGALTELSGRTGIAVEPLQKLAYAAEQGDSSIEALTSGIDRMSRAMVETPEKFAALGLSVEQLLKLSPDEQFLAIADALKGIENPTLQAAAAMDVFGRGGAQLLPLIRQDARALADEAQRLGIVLSGDVVKAADNLGDEALRLEKAWGGLKDKFGSVIATSPEVRAALEDVTKAVATLSLWVEKLLPLAAQGVSGLIAYAEGLRKFAVAALGPFADLVDAVVRYKTLQAELNASPPDPKTAVAFGKEQVAALTEVERKAAAIRAEALKVTEKQIADETRAREEAARKNLEIAARNADLDGKITADMLARDLKARETQSAQLQAVKLKERVTLTQIAEDAAEAEKDVAERTARWKEQRAKAEAAVLMQAEEALEATREENLQKTLDRIERERQANIAKTRDLVEQGKISEQVGLEAEEAYERAAEAEEQYARQQDALLKIEKLRSLISSVGQVLEAFGVSAESGLGKAVKATDQLLAATGDFAEASAAYAKGDYLTAATKGLEGLAKVVGVVKEIFSKPEWKRVAADVGRDFGVTLSESLAKAIADDSKRIGDRVAATLLHLKEILAEAGGVKAFGVDQTIAKLRDLFSQLEAGKLTLTEVGKVFDDVFGELAPLAVSKTTGLASAQFKELIALARRFGVESQALNAWTQTQAQAALAGLQAMLKGATIASQAGAAAIGAAIEGAYRKLIEAGMTPAQALEAVTPAVQALREQLEKAGLDGGAAFALLDAQVALLADEIAGPLISQIHGAGQAISSLSNLNLLTAEGFAELTTQITASYAALEEQGKGGAAALALIAPDLQKIWELQKDFGYAVDEGTQALLDQAEAAGVVGEKHRDVQTRMADGLDRLNTVLEAFARHLGVDIPDAAQRGARGIEDAFGGVRIPPVQVGYEYVNVGGGIPPPDDRATQSFATGGFRDFGAGTLAMLHGREAIIPVDRSSAIGAAVARAILAANFTIPEASGAARIMAAAPAELRGGSSDSQVAGAGGLTQVVHIETIAVNGARDPRLVADEIVRAVRNNFRASDGTGVRTALAGDSR